MINYSFLSSDPILLNSEEIEEFLHNGIKVFAFCDSKIKFLLTTKLEEFISAQLLQVFEITEDAPILTLIDGKSNDNDSNEMLKILSKKAIGFNHEQYLIEHADPAADIIVEAGAGTGKTTVMIDRIMFLVQTVPGLTLEDIGMITFTNEAMQNMKHKIQSLLSKRYTVSKSSRFIKYLEDSSKLRIQTIDSFSKNIISELGTSIGYSNSIDLRSFKYEKRQLIRDILNSQYKKSHNSVERSLGGRLHELEALLLDYWTQLDNIGLTDDEIFALDWGLPEDKESVSLHETLKSSFIELNKQYGLLKMEEDSIAVSDISIELQKIITNGNELILKTHPLKYLFVDEFQDSDNSQIRTVAWLHQTYNLKLFVVGDIKQSIYRFRGAVETAFDTLRQLLVRSASPQPLELSLVRNYRTSKDVLSALDPIFRKWDRSGYLKYGNSLSPQKVHKGTVLPQKGIYCKIKNFTIKSLTAALEDCKNYTKDNNLENSPAQHVTVLVRTNHQLSMIGTWCAEEKIPCYINKDGTFFSSQAVKDLFSLVKAYVFPFSSIHLFDYICSSYTVIDEPLDKIMYSAPGSNGQHLYLQSLLGPAGWEKNIKAFRLQPVMSVLRSVIEEAQPTKRYVAKRKQELLVLGWDPVIIEDQVKIEAQQYQANTERALQILRKSFTGEMASLYQIYEFLKLNIATNKTEDEPNLSSNLGFNCIYGMTVHKAKGLEFDTVIIPFTNRLYRRSAETELLITEGTSSHQVGWCQVSWESYNKKIKLKKCNKNYTDCLPKEYQDIDREEARLLYVALTRCIRRLEYFIVGKEEHSWAHLLEV